MKGPTEVFKREVIERYQKCRSMKVVATELHCSTSTVHKILREANIQLKKEK